MVYLLLSLILKIKILDLFLNELCSFKAIGGIRIIINDSSSLNIGKKYCSKI